MNTERLIVSSESIPSLQTGHSQVQFLTPQEPLMEAGLSVIRGTVDGLGIVPLHSHAAPESVYILQGEMEVYEETEGRLGTWAPVKQGDYAVIRANAKHAWRNTTSTPCTVLIFTNVELTEFLRGLCDIDKTSLSLQEAGKRSLELSNRHHCWLATSAENAAIGVAFP